MFYSLFESTAAVYMLTLQQHLSHQHVPCHRLALHQPL